MYYGKGGTLSNTPTRYPAIALTVPINIISTPLRIGLPTVTHAL